MRLSKEKMAQLHDDAFGSGVRLPQWMQDVVADLEEAIAERDRLRNLVAMFANYAAGNLTQTASRKYAVNRATEVVETIRRHGIEEI